MSLLPEDCDVVYHSRSLFCVREGLTEHAEIADTASVCSSWGVESSNSQPEQAAGAPVALLDT